MDGDIKQIPSAETDAIAGEPIDVGRRSAPRPKTARWMAIVGLLLVVVLGALYGFNRFREQAIATFFANNKPPPAQISAVIATVEPVPHFATGIGTLAAVHQVTITPEVGGRVTEILFKPGEAVKAGDPLVQLNDAPDRGDLANYQAQSRLAAITLERSQTLAKRQYTPLETVDQNQAQLDEAQAQIAKTEAIIAQKLIRAPFGGKLGIRQIDLGQYLNPGAAIVTLTDLSPLYVNFTLPSEDRAAVVIGQHVDVTVDAISGRTFPATVTTIEPQIRADTRTLQVQATMPNPDGKLLPGMFANAAVVLPPQPDSVVLPETAVDYTLYGDSVYVIREEGKDAKGQPALKAIRTPVTTGTRWGNKVAILDGVKPGDRVVAAGQIKLQSGASVIVSAEPPPQPPANPTNH